MAAVFSQIATAYLYEEERDAARDAQKQTAIQYNTATDQLEQQREFTLAQLHLNYTYNKKVLSAEVESQLMELDQALKDAGITAQFEQLNASLTRQHAIDTEVRATEAERSASGFIGGTNKDVIQGVQQYIDDVYDITMGEIEASYNSYEQYITNKKEQTQKIAAIDRANLQTEYEQNTAWAQAATDSELLGALQEFQAEASALKAEKDAAEYEAVISQWSIAQSGLNTVMSMY